jgi:serine/threonine protein kinase
MSLVKAPQSEPLPGYRLVELLGRGGFGEVWKCEAPGGLFKAIKFISGGDEFNDPEGAGARRELRASQLIKSIRHPFLLTIERIEIIDKELLILMELADRSLHDRLMECRSACQAGIPRKELLGYLREAAEAIDVLNQEHGLQHLDIKPRNLFLIGRHVKVADFGLVTSLSDLEGHSSWLRRSETLTPLYAPPETFLGRCTLFSDQYSLAITYQELLTGTLPFTGRNARQLALAHVQEPPDLEQVPEAERPILARALAKEPSERYPSCTAFVQALFAAVGSHEPRRTRTPGTHSDLALGELATTPTGSREVPAVFPSSVGPPTERGANQANVFLAGYQLLECVQRHAATQTWKAHVTDGRKRLVKIVNDYDPGQEWPGGDPLVRLLELRHAVLPQLEAQTDGNGRLALICDLPDGSLACRLRECRQLGKGGIPRPQLLVYLRQAAEALDALQQCHRLQHLSLTPSQLALRNGLLCLLDFAVVELLWLPMGHDPAALNTRYAAPELFEGQISPRCDQYSLALIYQELLTGVHAFRNGNQRQMAVARLRGKPALGLLTATDRPIVAQALEIDPERRFPSCTAFVDALDSVDGDRGSGSNVRGTWVPAETVSVPRSSSKQSARCAQTLELPWERSLEEMKQIIGEQVAAAARTEEIRGGGLRYRFVRPADGDKGPALVHLAYGRIVSATVPLKLAAFGELWNGQRIESPSATPEPGQGEIQVGAWSYRIAVRGNVWQRWLGRLPSLRVRIELTMPRASGEGFMDARIRISPRDCGADRGKELLETYGPQLLRSVRDHLQLPVDRRQEERISWVVPVQVRPLFNGRELGEPFAAMTRDLCNIGLGLELPCRLPSAFLLVELTPPHRAPLTLPLQVLHEQSLGDGRYYVGGRFAWELVGASRC